jgi:hypothetical protein
MRTGSLRLPVLTALLLAPLARLLAGNLSYLEPGDFQSIGEKRADNFQPLEIKGQIK